jgi:hypothetical protein
MTNRGRRSHTIRDLWIFLSVEEERKIESPTLGHALKMVRSKFRHYPYKIHLSDGGFRAAYRHGQKLYGDSNLRYEPRRDKAPQKTMGRPFDAVWNYIVYEAVCEALSNKGSLRQAYRLAQEALQRDWSEYAHLSVGNIRFIHQTVKKHLSSPFRPA